MLPAPLATSRVLIQAARPQGLWGGQQATERRRSDQAGPTGQFPKPPGIWNVQSHPVSSVVGEISSQKQTPSFLVERDVKDPLTQTGGPCPEGRTRPYPFSRRPTWTMLCDSQSIAPPLCATVSVVFYSGERQDPTERSPHTKGFYFRFYLEAVFKVLKHLKRNPSGSKQVPWQPCLF